VAAENDVGRDAYVDLVEGSDITGSIVALQVKGGSSFRRRSRWLIPGTSADFALWRDSSVPIFGIMHNPLDNSLRWTNLSDAARRELSSSGTRISAHPVVDDGYGGRAVVVPDNNRLDLSIEDFLKAAREAIRLNKPTAALQLFSEDRQEVVGAVLDCFAIGRQDPRAFLLLQAALTRLPAEAVHEAVWVLATATGHPDIFWHEGNWVPEHIKAAVRQRGIWSENDVALLLTLVLNDDNGWGRGSFGQTVFHVLRMDANLEVVLDGLLTDLRRSDDLAEHAALLAIYLASENAPAKLEEIAAARPSLFQQGSFISEVKRVVDEWGWIDLF
jgi:hypothetical protein